MADVEVDVKALRDFQKAITDPNTGLLAAMDSDSGLQDSLAAVDPSKANPKLDVSGAIPYAQFSSAHDLAGRYAKQFGLWNKNYHSLRDALALLATVAGELADNYDRAKDFDSVSAKTVDDTFQSTSVPQPSTTSTTQTTGTPPHYS